MWCWENLATSFANHYIIWYGPKSLWNNNNNLVTVNSEFNIEIGKLIFFLIDVIPKPCSDKKMDRDSFFFSTVTWRVFNYNKKFNILITLRV